MNHRDDRGSGRRLRLTAGAAVIAVLSVFARQSPIVARQRDFPGQREDLATFEREFFAVDRAYSPSARAEAAKSLADLRTKVGSISDATFALMLSQIVALADNGHSLMITLGRFPEMAKDVARVL